MLYQQGDVLIETVDSIPGDAEKMKNHRNTLAEGEVTGHAHRVVGVVDMFRQESNPTDVFMSAPRRIVVKHEEHGPITLDPGNYRVRKVREYDYVAQEARAVRD